MKRTATVLALTAVLALGACETRSQVDPTDPDATSPTSPTDTGDVAEHESGPQSPLSFGLEVPDGATQLGPLVRYRSAALIQAFQPELDAALAEREAAEERAREEAEEAGEEPPTPAPTPETRPSEDTFAALERPPKPDVTISLMRVDGDPTTVLRRMLAQVDTVLPDADLVTDDIGEYCESTERRITGCEVVARGMTVDDRDLRITVTVDPGDLATRTAYVASALRPVMTLKVQYVGDPRSGQLEPRPESVDVPRDVEGEDTSGLIWPSMDVEAAEDTELVEGWTTPDEATVLLSGARPRFVSLATDRVRQADEIAEDVATSVGEPTKDVVEDLNEISTTYTARSEDGTVVRSIFVLSARGNYVMLLSTPPAD